MLKVVRFLDGSLILVELFFEAIPSSYFVQQTSQKSELVVKDKKQFRRHRRLKFRIILDLGVKLFQISSTGIESISHSLHNLTSSTDVAAKNKNFPK